MMKLKVHVRVLLMFAVERVVKYIRQPNRGGEKEAGGREKQVSGCVMLRFPVQRLDRLLMLGSFIGNQFFGRGVAGFRARLNP